MVISKITIKKMNTIFVSLFIFISCTCFGQFPYEKHPSPKYLKYNNWIITEKENALNKSLSIPKFYKNGDSLTIKITSFDIFTDSSSIKLHRNNALLQTFTEFSTFSMSPFSAIYTADFNGDHLTDLKFYAPQPGNGIAYMNNAVVYLFQNKDESFTKISFIDMFDYGANSFKYRAERDFNDDNNYEIITMTLLFHENHSYWTYNLYNYINGTLINVSLKNQYPIMIQYLFQPNFKVTNKISKKTMQTFTEDLPNGYSKE